MNPKTLEDFNNPTIIRSFFFNGRMKRKWSSGTYLTYLGALSVFVSWCITNGFIQAKENEVKKIEKPKLEKRIPPKLSKQQAMKILESIFNYPYAYRYLRYRNHAIFATFLFAGLRRSELIRLKMTDVDLENMTLHIRQGKGKKDRMIPMSFTLTQILLDYLKERKRLLKTCPEFFASMNRNLGITTHGLKHMVNTFRKVTGLKFHLHQLRHTFATLMLEGGCDIYSLSRMMGHSDIKTTTIYLRASAEHLRGEMRKHPLNHIG